MLDVLSGTLTGAVCRGRGSCGEQWPLPGWQGIAQKAEGAVSEGCVWPAQGPVTGTEWLEGGTVLGRKEAVDPGAGARLEGPRGTNSMPQAVEAFYRRGRLKG